MREHRWWHVSSIDNNFSPLLQINLSLLLVYILCIRYSLNLYAHHHTAVLLNWMATTISLTSHVQFFAFVMLLLCCFSPFSAFVAFRMVSILLAMLYDSLNKQCSSSSRARTYPTNTWAMAWDRKRDHNRDLDDEIERKKTEMNSSARRVKRLCHNNDEKLARLNTKIVIHLLVKWFLRRHVVVSSGLFCVLYSLFPWNLWINLKLKQLKVLSIAELYSWMWFFVACKIDDTDKRIKGGG